jgi:hypothetical protein
MREKEKVSSGSARLSRRELLLQMGGFGLLTAMASSRMTAMIPAELKSHTGADPGAILLSPEDDQLLDELEKRSFQFFWEQVNPQSGLIRDRCHVAANDNSVVASIAATGFGLTALCIGEHRKLISFPEARDRVLATLRFLWKKMPTHRGFFYHFADLNTGERVWDSEVSSVDTAILL